jgi:hypothetical protein
MGGETTTGEQGRRIVLRSRGQRRIRLGLLLNALRWRAGSSAVFFVVALLAVAAATAGPVYLAAADQSVLAHVVVPPPPESTGLVVNEQPGHPLSVATFRDVVARQQRSSADRSFFAEPIKTAIAAADLLSSSGSEIVVADAVARSGECQQLVFTAGRCPTGEGELALSTRSSAYLHIGLGTSLAISIGGSPRDYRVSGLYRAGSASVPYWWGSDYFEFGTALTPPPRMDALFVDFSSLASLPLRDVALGADLPVKTKGLLSTQIPTFRRALGAVEVALGSSGLLASSGIGSFLGDVASQQQAMTTTITVIDLQLLLLVLIVLFGIAGRIAAERDQDLALANLRGLSPRSLWAVALREPVVLILAAAPLGAVMGWFVALATARAELLAGTPVRFDSLALAAALAAAVVSLCATAVGSRRALARSARRSGAGRSRLAVALGLSSEAFVVALAIAAVVQVSASGVGTRARSQPLAALAPGLIALAAGVLAARAVPLACRLIATATRFGPRVGLSLALQRVARQSGIIRQAVIIAIAVSLACFAVAGFSIDRANRSEQAAFFVGSARVLTVSVPATVDFENAVRQADPSGQKAMAAEIESSSAGTLLAVDTSRFAPVASWAKQPGAALASAVARFLGPPVAPEVTVEGSDIELTADLRARVHPSPSLTIDVFNKQYGASESVTIGPLEVGRHAYVTSLAGYCVSVCRLQSITANWGGPSSDSASSSSQRASIPVEIEAIGEGEPAKLRPVAAGLSHKGWWRVMEGAPGMSSLLSSSSSGLLAVFGYIAGQTPPVIAPADTPELVPAVVTNVVASLSGGGPTGSTQYSVLNLDGSSLNINGAMQVAALPEVGTNAVMVDLTDALRNESLPDIYSTKQVWLSAAAGSGAAILKRLGRDGIRVLSTHSASAMELEFALDGPTLAFELFVVVGLESALLATGSMLYAVAADTRQRAIEAVALSSVGLPRRSLVAAIAGELGIVCVTGLAAGALAGIAAAHFSLPSVPEFTGLSPGPTLMFALPWGWLGLVLGGATVLLALAVAVSIAIVSAASTPDKLRISQQ